MLCDLLTVRTVVLSQKNNTLTRDFIKFSEFQVPLCKFKPLIQDFLVTVLVFKLHIFSRGSLVVFNSYQSEKVRITRIVNLTVTIFWVRVS